MLPITKWCDVEFGREGWRKLLAATYLEARVLVWISAQVPAGALAGMGKERLGARDVGRAEVVVFDFGAFEGDALELVDGDFGERGAAEKEDGRVAEISNDETCQQDEDSA